MALEEVTGHSQIVVCRRGLPGGTGGEQSMVRRCSLPDSVFHGEVGKIGDKLVVKYFVSSPSAL